MADPAVDLSAAAAPSAPPMSISDAGSNDNYKKIVGQESKLLEQKIGLEAAQTAAMQRRDKQYDQRMERLVAAEGHSADDLKPWNAEQEMAKHETSLWDSFGSPAFIISMMASAFSAQPMNSALTAGGAAIKAQREGDIAAYNKAFDAWKQNTDLAVKRQEMEHREFEDIAHLRQSDMASWRANMEALLQRFNDQHGLVLLQNGMDSELIEKIAGSQKAAVEIAQSKKFIEQNDLRSRIVAMQPDWPLDENGKPKEGVKPDPQKMATAISRAETIIRGPDGTPEGQMIYNTITAPGFSDLSGEAQNKKILEVYTAAEKAKHPNVLSADKQALQRFMEEHPEATADEIQSFLRKGKAVRSPQAMALQKYIDEHPEATSADITKFAGEFSSIQKADRDFATGKQGQQINSLNVGISHVETLRELGEALNNGNMKRFNQVAQKWAEETGNPAPTNFDTAVKFVGPEIVKALVAGGGGVGERDEMTKAFSRISGPAAMEGAIDTAERLLSGQFVGLGRMYKQTTKKDDFDERLTPEALKVFSRFQKKNETGESGWKIERVE